MIIDRLCYQFCMWFPIWWLNPRGRVYSYILHHGGGYANDGKDVPNG